MERAKHNVLLFQRPGGKFHDLFDLDADDYIEIYEKINNSDGTRKINGLPANQKGSTFGAFILLT